MGSICELLSIELKGPIDNLDTNPAAPTSALIFGLEELGRMPDFSLAARRPCRDSDNWRE